MDFESWPTAAAAAEQAAQLTKDWIFLCHIQERSDIFSMPCMAPQNSMAQCASFASLDADSIRAIGNLLPAGEIASSALAYRAPSLSVRLDRRSHSLVALASVNRSLRSMLQSNIEEQQHLHQVRLESLCSISTRLGTSLGALRAARTSFSQPGYGRCFTCDEPNPQTGGLFVHQLSDARVEREALNLEGAEGELETATRELELELHPGQAHCAHCWRGAHEMMMRMASGVEQTWEEEVDYDDGSWRLVQDFSGMQLDSPLLAREEYSRSWPFAQELVAGLCISGYVLGCGAWDTAAAGDAESEEGSERSPSRWDLSHSILLADLISSGYADHLLSIDLSESGVDDEGLERLSHALVGYALQVQYLDLSGNPITCEGIVAFAGLLSPRKFELMLPLLRWLHFVLDGGRFGNRGAVALGAALRAGALPSLEVLWAVSEVFDAALAAPSDEAFRQGQHEGFAALTGACVVRGIALELDH